MAKSSLPRDFEIPQDLRAWARKKGLEHVLDDEFEHFCNYWWSNGNTKLDWNATLRTWILKNKAKARQISRPLSQIEHTDTRVFDRWDIAANTHFLKYVRKRFARYPNLCGAPGAIESPNPEFRARVLRLVGWKNAWARDMREWDGEPTREEQKSAWVEIMKRAEQELKDGYVEKAA